MKKIRKGKILAGGLFALAGIAVGGVGFSSWIVTINQSQTTAPISVAVSDTQDKSIKIFYASVTDGDIKFDGKAPDLTGGKTADPRLSFSTNIANDDGEDLDFAVKYYVATTDVANVGKVTAKFVKNQEQEAYVDWFTQGTPSKTFVTTDYSSTSQYVVSPFGNSNNANVLEVVSSGMVASTTGNTYDTGVYKFVTTVSSNYTKAELEESIGTNENKGDNWDLNGQTIPEFTGGDGYKYYAVTTTFNFAWSNKTEHKNPVQYVTDKSNTGNAADKLTDAAVQALANDLADLSVLDTCAFKIVLDAHAPQA